MKTFSDSLQQKCPRQKILSELTKLCGQKKKERETELVHGSWLRSISISNRTFHHLPQWLSSKESACQCRTHRRCRFDPWVRKIPWRRKRQHTSVFLHGKSHGQRSLVGYSPWGHKGLDMTEWLSTWHTWDIGMTSQRTGAWSCTIGALLKMWFPGQCVIYTWEPTWYVNTAAPLVTYWIKTSGAEAQQSVF